MFSSEPHVCMQGLARLDPIPQSKELQLGLQVGSVGLGLYSAPIQIDRCPFTISPNLM